MYIWGHINDHRKEGLALMDSRGGRGDHEYAPVEREKLGLEGELLDLEKCFGDIPLKLRRAKYPWKGTTGGLVSTESTSGIMLVLYSENFRRNWLFAKESPREKTEWEEERGEEDMKGKGELHIPIGKGSHL